MKSDPILIIDEITPYPTNQPNLWFSMLPPFRPSESLNNNWCHDHQSNLNPMQGPDLLLRLDVVGRILANGSVDFFESCAAIGWNVCDSVRSL